MNDPETIIYVLLLLIFLLSRLFRGAKKLQQPQQPAPPTVQPPAEEKPDLFETIRREIMRQQELQKQRRKAEEESKQHVPAPQKKIAKVSPQKAVHPPMPDEGTYVLDRIEGEGIGSLAEKIIKTPLPEEQEERPAAAFDPREAFMMKTLLERKFEV